MSEISRLASSFEQRSKSEAERIEKSVRSAFDQHEKALRRELKNAEKRTADAIHDHSRSLRRIALKTWLWVLLSLILVGSVSAGLLWLTGQQIASNVAEIQRQQKTLDQLRSQGGEIQTTRCGESRRLCIALDPSLSRYTTEDGTVYMIPRGY